MRKRSPQADVAVAPSHAKGRTSATAREPSAKRPLRHRPPSAIVASCAAATALFAAVVAAVGPAKGERSTYAWPPPELPASSPQRGWYAPLPLLNRVPASIDVRVPCDLAPALHGARSPTVIATARHPRSVGALRISRQAGALRISVGTADVATVPWPTACPLDVVVADGQVRIPNRTISLETDTLDHMPIVTGLFTDLDGRAGAPAKVVVRTRMYATSWTARQALAGLLSIALSCVVVFVL